ncbi:MAG TPA: AAA family ATPase [Candidatus Glassbacteria bacterium]|nr:AAA family ATPase [Candidatus Glassbacteria bacterium]
MSELMDSMWVEKYRPKKLEDLALPERYTLDFKRMIAKCELPNLLFSGPPGGGKTTLARVLCSNTGVLFRKDDNMLSVNGSSRKTRGIGFVDDVIEPFLKHPPGGDKYKVVFIDEADKLTADGYDSLRALIEKYHVAYGRFIFTCNYLSRIPDPIQSRFIPYVFSQIPKEFVLRYCKTILEAEKVDYKDADIQVAITNLYPDVRKIVNALQRASWEGKLKLSEKDVITNERKIVTFIRQIISFIEKGQANKLGSVVNSIVEIVSGQDLEYRNVYTELFFGNNIPAPAKIIINKYSNRHQNALVPHMHFMAMIFDIINSLQAFRKAAMG